MCLAGLAIPFSMNINVLNGLSQAPCAAAGDPDVGRDILPERADSGPTAWGPWNGDHHCGKLWRVGFFQHPRREEARSLQHPRSLWPLARRSGVHPAAMEEKGWGTKQIAFGE